MELTRAAGPACSWCAGSAQADPAHHTSQNSSFTTCNAPMNKLKSLRTPGQPSSTCMSCSAWLGYCLAKKMLLAVKDLFLRSPDKPQPHPSPVKSKLAEIGTLPPSVPTSTTCAVTVTHPCTAGAPRLFRRCPTIAASAVLGEGAGNHKAPLGNDALGETLHPWTESKVQPGHFIASCGGEEVSLSSTGLTISTGRTRFSIQQCPTRII